MGSIKPRGRWVVFFMALAVAVGLFWALRHGIIYENNQVNILILGVDARNGLRARSDSINLVHIDYARNRIGVLAIPRDMLVDIPGRGQDKVNHAHMFGGPELSCKVISRFTGIPINNYIELNFPMFVNLIDQLGGVTLDVEKGLYYDDYAGNLHISLSPGVQKLTGYEAMGYVRFRHDSASDWGRIDRQHKFFQAVVNEVSNPVNVVKLPYIMYGASSNIRTNLGVSQITKLALRVPGIYKNGAVVMGVIPGTDARLARGYYMIADEEGMKKVINEVIYDIK